MKRTKQIFISDIHMGTAESIQGDNPYGWFLKDRANLLTDFLVELAKDETLAELVIAGDLFDEWVVPYKISPTPTKSSEYSSQFAKIANAAQNIPVISALSNLANTDGITVTYVPGNHDMLIKADIIRTLVPRIKPIIQGPGKGVYTSNGILAEHGSLYCLFNGPDTYSHPPHSSLPLGFFVARSQAEGVTNGYPVTKKKYIEIFLDTLSNRVKGEPLAEAIFDSFVKVIHKAPSDDIKMNRLDGYKDDITTLQAGEIFKDIYDKWDKEMLDNVPATIAALDELGHLFPAVLLKFILNSKGDENIVILGHTHLWEIRGIDYSFKSLEKIAEEDIPKILEALKEGDIKKALSIIEDIGDPGPDKASDFIYANSGTWIDGDSGVAGEKKPPATYVVIDKQEGKTSVQVNAYKGGALGKSELLGERYLSK